MGGPLFLDTLITDMGPLGEDSPPAAVDPTAHATSTGQTTLPTTTPQTGDHTASTPLPEQDLGMVAWAGDPLVLAERLWPGGATMAWNDTIIVGGAGSGGRLLRLSAGHYQVICAGEEVAEVQARIAGIGDGHTQA